MPFVNVRTVQRVLTESSKRVLRTQLTHLIVEPEGLGNPTFSSKSASLRYRMSISRLDRDVRFQKRSFGYQEA
jgi:hypothetical protein